MKQQLTIKVYGCHNKRQSGPKHGAYLMGYTVQLRRIGYTPQNWYLSASQPREQIKRPIDPTTELISRYRIRRVDSGNQRKSIRLAALMPIPETTKRVPSDLIKPLQLVCCSGNRRWNRQVPNFQMGCNELTMMKRYHDNDHSNPCYKICPLLYNGTFSSLLMIG